MSANHPQRVQLQGDSFLEDLPPSIPRYLYKGKKKFRDVIYFECDRFEEANGIQVQEYHRLQRAGHLGQASHSQDQDTFPSCLPDRYDDNQRPSKAVNEKENLPDESVLFHIDSRSIQADFLDPSKPPIRFARCSFDLRTNLLLARMVTVTHSQVIGEFCAKMTLALNQIGLANSVTHYLGSTIRGDSSGKQGDLGWGPRPVPEGFADKPTVAVEVGVSQYQTKLERDVQWWLNPAKGNANLTVTIKVDRRKPRLTMNKWQRVDGEIERTQQVVISKGDNEQITVTDAPFTIPFDLMFRRQAAERESDIILDREALELLAGAVWSRQGF